MRTGDDPVAVDVLARVVAAVDRLMVSESFERPVLSETGPLLAAVACCPSGGRPARPGGDAAACRARHAPLGHAGDGADDQRRCPRQRSRKSRPEEAPEPETQPIDAVVVDDPDLVLPIPAPPRPQPAPRGRRLRRNSVA